MIIMLPFEKIKREVFVKRKASPGNFGVIPKDRSVEELIDYGIVNIDKPRGPTSHQVSSYVQNILNIKKSGHSGTLDPKVTGVLPIATGRATRIVQTLLVAGKEYMCLMHLHDVYDDVEIRKTILSFVGKIKQLPPIKSSVKRQWRYRKIYYIDILEIDGKDVLFRVGCQAGTYIRKLCHDIGQKLGSGAHMQELRRTKAGPFGEDFLITLQDLTDAFYYWKTNGDDKLIRKMIHPIEFAVSHLPKVWVLDSTVDSLCHGAMLGVPGISKVESDIQVGEMVAVLTLKNELIGLGAVLLISKQIVKKRTGLAVRMNKVFMRSGTYPKIQKLN